MKLTLGSVLFLVLVAGCKVTGEDIEQWKGTVKGPGKIVAVMLSDKYSMELRTQAALALVEMERQDVNGIVELQRTLQRLDEATRKALIEGMIPGLAKLMQQSDGAQAAESGPQPIQVRAKDAGFLLINQASPKARSSLIEAVVGWYAVDFNGRSLAGNYSAEQVVRSLGSSAAAILVSAMNARMPQPALIKIVELIGQLGDPAVKQRAGELLVKAEQEMEGPQFLDWLKTKVTASIQAQQPGATVDPKRVTQVAEVNRESFIADGALPAMKNLADQPAVAERLLAIASEGGNSETMTVRRTRALQALEGSVNESHLDRILAVALEPKNPDSVRDYAFDRIGDIRSRKALPKLWPLLQTKDSNVRGRAGALILHIGGRDVVSEFFAKLSAAAATEYSREELVGYATHMSQMTPRPTDLMSNELKSPQWWNRVMAIFYFERAGTMGDVPQLDSLSGDVTPVDGPHWPAGSKVGKVAKESIEGLKERLAQQASEGAAK